MGVIERTSPSPALRAARRELEGSKALAILDDWRWFEERKKWALHIRIDRIDQRVSAIPAKTEWYVLADPDYPLGTLKFYPSKTNCFSETYPHQLYNGPGGDALPWRTGELCLNTQVRKYDRYEDEPFEPEARLLWHCQQAIEWLDDAARGELAKDGDPFELPDFPGISRAALLAYQENSSALQRWQGNTEPVGLVELMPLPGPKNVLLVKQSTSLAGNELARCDWGRFIEPGTGNQKTVRAIWIRIPSVPVLAPWQAPATWGELRKASRSLGVKLDTLLKLGVEAIRDGDPHLGLIGFPIPERRGGSNSHLHWQALELPVVAHGKVRGFRPSGGDYWPFDREMNFSDGKSIQWVDSQNWDSGQISTRGKFGESLRSKSVLLIGAGSLASALGELLLRGGLERLAILDSDDVSVGNLTRHTLTLHDVGASKAEALAARLNKISPYAAVVGFKEDFPPTTAGAKEQVDKSDIIIDCTGSDQVIRQLEAYSWSDEKTFFCLSVGLEARRLFCFSMRGRCFRAGAFFNQIRPWLELERREHVGYELPREGTGCWNPVFPARADDVWLLVSSAVSTVENLERIDQATQELVVFERLLSEGRSIGVIRRTTVESGTERS